MKKLVLLTLTLLSGTHLQAQEPGALSYELQLGPSVMENTSTNLSHFIANGKLGLFYSLTRNLDWRMQLGYSHYYIEDAKEMNSQTFNFTYGFTAHFLRSIPVQPFLFIGSSLVGTSFQGETSSATRFDSSVGLSYKFGRMAIAAEMYHYFQDAGLPKATREGHYPIMLSLRYQVK